MTGIVIGFQTRFNETSAKIPVLFCFRVVMLPVERESSLDRNENMLFVRMTILLRNAAAPISRIDNLSKLDDTSKRTVLRALVRRSRSSANATALVVASRKPRISVAGGGSSGQSSKSGSGGGSGSERSIFRSCVTPVRRQRRHSLIPARALSRAQVFEVNAGLRQKFGYSVPTVSE